MVKCEREQTSSGVSMSRAQYSGLHRFQITELWSIEGAVDIKLTNFIQQLGFRYTLFWSKFMEMKRVSLYDYGFCLEDGIRDDIGNTLLVGWLRLVQHIITAYFFFEFAPKNRLLLERLFFRAIRQSSEARDVLW